MENKAETVIVSHAIPGLVKGYLEDFCEADIVVNSAPVNMKLKCSGDISNAILNRAGPQIQNECDEKYPNGIQAGQIAITGGYKLPYSLVFHCTVNFITNTTCYQDIANLIKKCLIEADGKEIITLNGDLRQVKSIAFPLIGTGGKNLPADVCCTFYRTILSFILGPTKSLENAYIIVHPLRTDLIQVIQSLKPLEQFTQSTFEFSYPYTWQSTNTDFDVIDLSPTGAEYALIREEFLNSAPPNATVLSIQRIQNKILYRNYLHIRCQKKLLLKSYRKELWMSCDPNNVQTINANGLGSSHLEVRKCGKGYYFYTESSSADDVIMRQTPTKSMYYCSVCVKSPFLGHQHLDENNIPPSCISVVDNIQQPSMYAIFKKELFYPNYLLTYKIQ